MDESDEVEQDEDEAEHGGTKNDGISLPNEPWLELIKPGSRLLRNKSFSMPVCLLK